jgi:hypothetical protein
MKHIGRKYSDGFTAMARVEGLGLSVAKATNGQSIDSPTKAVAIVLFTRIINNFLAIKTLLRRGFGMEGGILARSLLEDFINLMYITNHKRIRPDELARRYIAFQIVVKHNYKEVYKYYGIKLTPKERVEITRGFKQFRRRYPDGNLDDWSGRDSRAKAKDGQHEGLYPTLFRLLSGMTHGGPEAWTKLIQEEGTRVKMSIAPHEVWISEPVFAACELTIEAARVVAKVFAISKLEKKVGTVQRSVGPLLSQLLRVR